MDEKKEVEYQDVVWKRMEKSDSGWLEVRKERRKEEKGELTGCSFEEDGKEIELSILRRKEGTMDGWKERKRK